MMVYIHNMYTLMTQCERNPIFPAKQNLMTLLAEPKSRLDRYVCLVQNLLATTDPSLPDFPHVEAALKDLGETEQHIAEEKQQYDNMEKISLIEALWDIPLVKQGREFVRQGVLVKQCRRKVRYSLSHARALSLSHAHSLSLYPFPL